MPYLQFDLEAKKAIPSMARALGVSTAEAGWGLLELWEWCWARKTDLVGAIALRGFLGRQAADVGDVLCAFGFLESVENGDFRVKGATRYLRISAQRSEAGKRRMEAAERSASGQLLTSTNPAPAGDVSSGPPAASQLLHRAPSTEHRIEEETQVPRAALLSACADPPSPPKRRAADLQEAWNEGRPASLPEWREMSKRRRARTVMRLGDRDMPEWRAVIARIRASRFCCGENPRGWTASPDWLLQPETAAKVLEGTYDNRGKIGVRETTDEEFRRRMASVPLDENGDLVL